MKFDQIDPIFTAWANRHGLQVYTEYKDEEIRSVRMYGAGKEFADIGVDVVEEGHYVVGVGIARRPSRNSQFEQMEADVGNLDGILEQAYSKASGWLTGSA